MDTFTIYFDVEHPRRMKRFVVCRGFQYSVTVRIQQYLPGLAIALTHIHGSR